jgi:hypothetical protein
MTKQTRKELETRWTFSANLLVTILFILLSVLLLGIFSLQQENTQLKEQCGINVTAIKDIIVTKIEINGNEYKCNVTLKEGWSYNTNYLRENCEVIK